MVVHLKFYDWLAGEQEVKDHPQLYMNFKGSLGYKTPCQPQTP